MTNAEIKIQAEQKRDTLFNKCKLFWAFSNSQFIESKTELKEGEKYVSIGHGGYLPKGYLNTFLDGLKEINKWEAAQRKEQKQADKEAHIICELNNYECFYTGDISDALPTLLQFYKIEDIQQVFNKQLQTQF